MPTDCSLITVTSPITLRVYTNPFERESVTTELPFEACPTEALLPEYVTAEAGWTVIEDGRVLSPDEWATRCPGPGSDLICYRRIEGGFGNAVLGGILVAVGAVMFATPLYLFAPMTMGVGYAMLGSAAINALIPTPDIPTFAMSSQSTEETSPTYGFQGIQNSTRIGATVGIVYGEHRVGGQIIQVFSRNGYTVVDVAGTGTLTLSVRRVTTTSTMIPLGSVLPVVVFDSVDSGLADVAGSSTLFTTEVQIGDTLKLTVGEYEVVAITNATTMIVRPLQNGLGGPSVVAAGASYTIRRNTPITANTDVLYALLALSEGPIESIDVSTIEINQQPVANYRDITTETRLGTNSQAVITLFGNDTPAAFAADAAITTSRIVYTTNGKAVTGVEILVIAPAGLYYANDQGNPATVSVALLIEYKLTTAGGYTTWGTVTLSAASRTTLRRTIRIDGLAPGQYDIGISRNTVESTSLRQSDAVRRSQINEIINDKFAYPNVALLAVQALATEQLSGGLPTITAIVKGVKVRIWTSLTQYTVAWTDNPAWIVVDMLMNRRYGMGFFVCNLRSNRGTITVTNGSATVTGLNTTWLSSVIRGDRLLIDSAGRMGQVSSVNSDTQITLMATYGGSNQGGLSYEIRRNDLDIQSFLNWATFCSTLVSNGNGGTEKRAICNLVFDSDNANIWDSVLKVCGAGLATLVKVGTAITVKFQQAESAAQLFTMANIVAGSFKEKFLPLNQRYTSFEVSFLNASNGYQQDVVLWEDPLLFTNSEQERKMSLQFYGITRASQAARLARFYALGTRYITRTIEFEVGIDAIAVEPGDVIRFQHDVPQWGFGGRVRQPNLLTFSITLNNASWLKARSSVSPDVTTAPDGTNTADKLVEDATAGASHYLYRNNETTTIGGAYAFSVSAKSAGRTIVQLAFQSGDDADVVRAEFDLSAGTTIQRSSAGNGVFVRSTITDEGSGWWRCTIGAIATKANADLVVFLAESANDNVYDGNGTSGAYLWGGQFEVGDASSPHAVSETFMVTLDQAMTVGGGSYELLIRHHDDTIETKTISNGAGTYTTLTIGGSWATAPRDGEVVAFGPVGVSTKPFRVTSISRTAEFTARVTGVEYNAAIYDETGQTPVNATQFSLLPNPDAPPDQVTDFLAGMLGDQSTAIWCTWNPPQDSRYATTYIFQFINGGYLKVAEGRDGTAQINGAKRGETIILRAVAVGRNGALASMVDAPLQLVLIGAAFLPQDVAGLGLLGQGNDTNFVGKDAKFTWKERSRGGIGNQPIGQEVMGAGQGDEGDTFKNYRVEICNSDTVTLRRREYTVDPSYTYSFEKNTEDANALPTQLGGGAPARAFTIKVWEQDVFNQMSNAPAVLTVQNAAPALVDNITVTEGFSLLIIAWDVNRELDVVGYKVWGSTANGFTPDDTNLVYDGANTRLYLRLDVNVPYYVKVAAYDTFDPTTVNLSAQYTGTPLDIVIPELPDGSITETKIADDSISTPKLKANVITADKVATGAIITLSAQIGNAVITSAKILSLDASKIVAQTVTSDRFVLTLWGDLSQAIAYVVDMLTGAPDIQKILTVSEINTGTFVNAFCDSYATPPETIAIKMTRTWDDGAGAWWDQAGVYWNEPVLTSLTSWESPPFDCASNRTGKCEFWALVTKENPATATLTVKATYRKDGGATYGTNAPDYDNSAYETLVDRGVQGGSKTMWSSNVFSGVRYVKYKVEITTSVSTDQITIAAPEMRVNDTRVQPTQINLVSSTTVGAAGGASALPATPLGYFTFNKTDGTPVKVPYYNT